MCVRIADQAMPKATRPQAAIGVPVFALPAAISAISIPSNAAKVSFARTIKFATGSRFSFTMIPVSECALTESSLRRHCSRCS